MLIETLSNLETVKTLGTESIILRRWRGLIDHAAKYSLRSKTWSAMNVNIALFIQQFSYVSMVVFGVYLIANGVLTVGGLIACTILNGRALAPLTQIAGLLMRYQQSRTAFEALHKVMNQPQETPPDRTVLECPLLTGEIAFRQVNFAYLNSDQKILKEINIQINKNEKIGIIGRTGSGKSTLARLILNLYQPTDGNVLVDGVDVRQFDPEAVRRQMGYVPQEVALFYGTVRENLSVGAPLATDQQLLQAIRIAGMEEWLQRHPSGLDMPIGENGRGLSGGQRQSIALARALMNNPNILLFDEPTNGLDNQAEEQFKQRLQPHLEHKTLLLITHRASLLSLVQRLIVLDNGKIIADGARDAVLQALSTGQIKINA
jgi:ATP-binding cassette subfamily C protein LapB